MCGQAGHEEMPRLRRKVTCPYMSPGRHDHRQWRQNDGGLGQGQAAFPVHHLCQVNRPSGGPQLRVPHSFVPLSIGYLSSTFRVVYSKDRGENLEGAESEMGFRASALKPGPAGPWQAGLGPEVRRTGRTRPSVAGEERAGCTWKHTWSSAKGRAASQPQGHGETGTSKETRSLGLHRKSATLVTGQCPWKTFVGWASVSIWAQHSILWLRS